LLSTQVGLPEKAQPNTFWENSKLTPELMQQVPDVVRQGYKESKGVIIMSIKITDACAACGFCLGECKNEAIKEGDGIYIIDPDKCTECAGWFESPQCVEVCAVGACIPDPDHKESRKQLLAK
jgi:ferredoxin